TGRYEVDMSMSIFIYIHTLETAKLQRPTMNRGAEIRKDAKASYFLAPFITLALLRPAIHRRAILMRFFLSIFPLHFRVNLLDFAEHLEYSSSGRKS
ncbi:MAG: hypothetical protein ACREOO_06915, partial [bacterium]